MLRYHNFIKNSAAGLSRFARQSKGDEHIIRDNAAVKNEHLPPGAGLACVVALKKKIQISIQVSGLASKHNERRS